MAQDLKLSVLLKAIDQATGPLKKITNASGTAATALKRDRSELKNLTSAQKSLARYKGLKRSSMETSKSIRAQQDRIAALSREIKHNTGATGRLEQKRRTAIRQAHKLQRQYEGEQRKINDLSAGIKRASGVTGSFSRQEAALDRKIAAANKRIKRQQHALKLLGQAKLGGTFRNMTASMARFGRRAGLVLGGVAAGIFGLAKSTADMYDKLDKQAKELGVSTQSIQEYQYAAELGGMTTEAFDTNLERFVKRLGQAANGTGAAKKSLKALGLNASKLQKMGLDDTMDAVADAMQDVQSQTQRVAIASDLFGRYGIKMVNIFNHGSEGLHELRKQARATGYVLGNDARKNADAFATASARLSASLMGVRNTIGVKLLPTMTKLMDRISNWLQQNRGRVVRFAKTFSAKLRALVPKIVTLAKGVGKVAATFGHLIKKAAELAGGFHNLAVIVAAVFAAKVIGSTISFGIAIGKVTKAVWLMNTAMLANPIGAIIAALAGLAAAAYMVYRNWSTFVWFFKRVWSNLNALFELGAMQVKSAWMGLTSWFSSLWHDIDAAFDSGIGGVIKLLINWSPMGILYKGIQSALGKLGIKLPKDLASLGLKIIDGLIDGLKSAWSALKSTVNEMASSIVGWFKGVASGIGDALSGVLDALGPVGDALRMIGHLIGVVIHWLANLFTPLDASTRTLNRAAAAGKAVGYAIGVVVRDAIRIVLAPIRLLAHGAALLVTHWSNLPAFFSSLWQRVKGFFTSGIGHIVKTLVNWSPMGILYTGIQTALGKLGIKLPKDLASLGLKIIDGLIGGLKSAWSALKSTVSEMASSIVGWFKDVLGIASPSRAFADLGRNIVDGIIQGLMAKLSYLKNKVVGLAKSVAGWFKGVLGIESPSRVFAGFGRYTVEGYQRGLASRQSATLAQIDAFARRVRTAGAGLALASVAGAPALAGSVGIDHRPPLATAASAPAVHYHVSIGDIHAAPGMDEQALADYVASEVQRALAEAHHQRAAERRSALYDTD